MKPEQMQQAIKEFKGIYEEEFKEDLTDQEATEKAIGLLTLLETLTISKEKGL